MAKSKSGYCAAIDKLPWILRLIFALPVLDGIIYGIYRICSGVASGSVLKLWVSYGFSSEPQFSGLSILSV